MYEIQISKKSVNEMTREERKKKDHKNYKKIAYKIERKKKKREGIQETNQPLK